MEVERLPGSVDPIALVAHPELDEAAMVSVDGWTVVVGRPLAVLEDLADLALLRTAVPWHRTAARTPVVPFASGAVGWIGDDVSRSLLEVGGLDPRPPSPAARMRLGLHDAAVCIGPGGEAWLAAEDLPGLSRETSGRRVERWRRLVRSAPPAAGTGSAPRTSPTRVSLDAQAHAAAVARAQEWIGAGDLYQLNLTLQVAVDWPHAGAALARRLLAASAGAAHGAWLRTDGLDVVSVSPETFLRVTGRDVVTRPIKGTRPRRADTAADEAEADALRASAKDGAEHVMIVDLERNDLGRVCEVGSVRVPELLALERHPTVWHLASTVRGTLREGTDLAQVLAAAFPPGSVTGAPKRMAWQRITALEPVRRGAYCGAIGVVTPSGCDLSVAIRTAVLSGGVASYGTGGGIVADSVAAEEWAEAMDKAEPFAAATGAVLPRRQAGATAPPPSRSSGSRSAC